MRGTPLDERKEAEYWIFDFSSQSLYIRSLTCPSKLRSACFTEYCKERDRHHKSIQVPKIPGKKEETHNTTKMAIEPLISSDPESPPTVPSTSQDHPHPLKQHRLYDQPASPPPSSPTTTTFSSPPRPQSQHSHRASVQFLSGMDPLSPSTSSRGSSTRNSKSGLRARLGLGGVARRTLGITLLLFTVCLWTVSNFLASYIFSDNTYSKPFFLVYINTSIFPFVCEFG